MKYFQLLRQRLRYSLFAFAVALLSLIPIEASYAEGSWQMGLFEGLSYRQPLRETVTTGLGRNVLYVDIESPGEVINVLICGTADSNSMRVQVLDPFGATVYDNTAVGNVGCNDDFDHTFDPATTNAHQYETTTTGTYNVHLFNDSGSYVNRYDITVTDSVTDLIDPRASGGRLWSDYWYFWAGSFAESASTDADLYVVADGGFTNTYYVWKLDLNNFAGYGYGLKANDTGVRSPNAAGDVVSGISTLSSGNNIDQKYKMYLSYPAKNYPLPSTDVSISPLTFQDATTTDNAILSDGNGSFYFDTNISSSAIYEIIMDNSDPVGGAPDGVYGQGDIYLRGVATPGSNVVPWDGKDNNGNTIPLGVYNAQLSIRLGEFHFVADDVETSGGPGSPGLRIYKTYSDGSDSPTTVYWDDFTVLGQNDPTSFNQAGIYEGDHNWGVFGSGGVGNNTYIDTYTFGDSITPNPAPVAVVDDDTVLISIAKSFTPETVAQGDTSAMQFEIGYTGTVPQTGITVSDTMPFGMVLVSDPSSITVTGAGCSGFAFSADTVAGGGILNIIDGTIAPGSVCLVTANVTGALPGELVNQASAVTSNENTFGVPSNFVTLNVTPSVSGTPFACDATVYESETVGSSTRLYALNTSVSPVSRAEFSGLNYSPSEEYRYNGLAYNPADGYLYGIVTELNAGISYPEIGSIVRIDQEGKVVNLGLPEQGPNTMTMPVVSDRYVGGTMTSAGKYVVVTDNSATSHVGTSIPANERGLILEFDLTVNPPQVLFNWQHGRDVGDITAYPDGRLLSHTPTEGLMSIDSETGNVNVVGGNVSSAISSIVANSSGQLLAHTESTGELISIDAKTGNGTVVSALAGGSTADGASCSYGVGMQKTVSLTEIEAGNAVGYELTIFNGSDSTISFDLIDDLQNTRTFVAGSLVHSLGGATNVYANTNLLNITGATLAANSSTTVQFDVMYPAGVGVGLIYNQAEIQITGQPSVPSDYPETFVVGDATPIDVLPFPSIGVSKRGLASEAEVTYWFNIVNTGLGDLTDVSLSDDLDAVFGAGNYSMVFPPQFEVDPGTITLNSSFSGSGGNTDLIDSTSSTLAESEYAVIRVTVKVDTLSDMGNGYGVYSNQVDVVALSPLGGVLTDQSVDGKSVDPNGNGIPDEQSPTIVSLQAVFSVTGFVFEDNGVATAHDGIMNGAESPLEGVTVELRDSSNTVVDSVLTKTDGSYDIAIPFALDGTSIQIVARATQGYTSISEAFDLGAVGSVVDSAVSLTPNSSTAINYQIDFGRVKAPSWLKNNVLENNPGAVVLHLHQYRAYTSGDLSFSYTNQSSSPFNPSYSAVLFLDADCNGELNGGEGIVPSSLAVVESTQVCIINKIIIPSNASNSNTYLTTIMATLFYEDLAVTGHGVSSALELTDITRTVVFGEGVLVVSKTVENLNAGPGATTSNSADPQDVLRYRVDFNNDGTGPVTEILVADSTPAFSVLESSVQCPAILPVGIVACQVLVPSGINNAAGYSGPVRWQFDGSFVAGANGAVTFDVRVE